MLATSLFDQIVALSRLSPIFAKGALTRAFQRAGVSNLELLTKAQLKVALPEIKKTLQSFLGDQHEEIYQQIFELSN